MVCATEVQAAGGVGDAGDRAAFGVAADSALAMFLIGLAVGVPVGVGLFFAYLLMRERTESEQDRELEALLSAVSDNDAPNNVWGRESADSREPFEREGAEERADPWERPADWWRHAGE